MQKSRVPSHYKTLRVPPDASPDEVRLAYRRMAQKYHPDRHSGKAAAVAIMALVNGAYEVLGDPQRRAQYDELLAQEQARRSRTMMRVAAMVPTIPNWSWVLLSAIVAVCVTTLALVTLYSLAPRQVAAVPARGMTPPAPVVDATPLLPPQRIEPWQEPAASTRPTLTETEPVNRLVRDGVLPGRLP